MTCGFHAPLPPARTGVADYAAGLLRGLRQLGDVRVDAREADVHLYHIGNNQLHRGIYRQAIERPGVAVLHDAVLQHLFLGSLSESEYVDEFVYNYGEWHRERGRELWRERGASATDERYFRYPMLKRIAGGSRAVVVHNAGAAAMVLAHAPDAEVVTIPHFFEDPSGVAQLGRPQKAMVYPTDGWQAVSEWEGEWEAIAFRRALGIPVDAFVFGVFGYLRESKRVAQTLDAFARLRAGFPEESRYRVAMLVAGDFVSSDLARACEPLLGMPGVFRVPHLSERDFWIAASAVDACVNLRVPAAGETSGIAIRMMGIGKPVLLTESLDNSGFPAGGYLPVPAGVAESSALFDYMGILALDHAMSREIGRVAAEHIGRVHGLGRIAETYWELLCRKGVENSKSI